MGVLLFYRGLDLGYANLGQRKAPLPPEGLETRIPEPTGPTTAPPWTSTKSTKGCLLLLTPRSKILSCVCIPIKLQQMDGFPFSEVHVKASDVIAPCCYGLFYVVVNQERKEGVKAIVTNYSLPGCCSLLHLINPDASRHA